MIGHARAQIMAVGVDRFNINEVLRQAGGSKATLVKYFGDRTGLIAAAIGAEARSAMADLGFDTAIPLSMPLGEALQRVLWRRSAVLFATWRLVALSRGGWCGQQ
jgi:AcrR family transcriptional regulator